MKYKLLLIIALIFIYASSCNEDEPEIEPFDHVAQAVKDNDSLVKYFQTHYMNDGEILEITSETGTVTSLNEDDDLKNETVILKFGEDDINFKLYYYITEDGVIDEEFPTTRVDMAHVIYVGKTLDGEVFDRNDYGSWWDLFSGVVKGWSYGIKHFSPGTKGPIQEDDTYEYSDTGKGYIFFPSGLMYQNGGSIPNKPVIFYIELNDVFHTDHDEDGIYSMFEVENLAEPKYLDFDTDGDNVPNFLDKDDDGDDTLTEDEKADPNGDHNPNDAVDSDGNGVFDYLDPDTP